MSAKFEKHPLITVREVDYKLQSLQGKKYTKISKFNKASQAVQSPRTVPFFLLISLLDGYLFANVHVKGIVAFKH